MFPVLLTAFLTCVVLVISVMACVSDARSLRIPNLYSIIVVGAFFVVYAISPHSFDAFGGEAKLSAHLLAFGLIFLIAYISFVVGAMGGGDVKFGSALALWVGLSGFVPYVFWMMVMGGFISALSFFIKKKKPFPNPAAESWIAEVQQGRNAVPYGIAISFGAWIALLQNGFLTHQLDEVIRIIH